MGQIQFTVSLVLIALFTVAIIGFAINFGIDNNAAVNIADDPELSALYTRTGTNLSTFGDDSKGTYESIVESGIASGGQTTATGAAFSVTPANVVGITKNILKVGYVKVFGSGSGFNVFLTTFLALIVFIIGLYVWKTWAGRTPD